MELAGHTVKAYDQQLNSLLELIQCMGLRVSEMLGASKRALKERSQELVDIAKHCDTEINRLEVALEEEATITLALQNPLAVDLRFVTSALKISGMLERAGDLAKNIIKRSTRLGEYHSPETNAKLGEMADIIISMLDEALSAVRERNADKAIAVWKRDDAVDKLYHAIFATMQQEMLTDKKNIEACTHIVFMAKNYERLADYVTNVAKTVHYIVTGDPATKAILKGQAGNA